MNKFVASKPGALIVRSCLRVKDLAEGVGGVQGTDDS